MALRDARPCPTGPASSTTSINMAIDWSKLDKKSLAVLVGMCILFNWVNGKLVPWMENKWKWRAELKAKANLVRAEWDKQDFPEDASVKGKKTKKEGKKKK